MLSIWCTPEVISEYFSHETGQDPTLYFTETQRSPNEQTIGDGSKEKSASHTKVKKVDIFLILSAYMIHHHLKRNGISSNFLMKGVVKDTGYDSEPFFQTQRRIDLTSLAHILTVASFTEILHCQDLSA